jgi:hypothetical protein
MRSEKRANAPEHASPAGEGDGVNVAEESSVDKDRKELADRHDHARRERSLQVIGEKVSLGRDVGRRNVKRTKDAMVLSKTMRPTAEAAEKTQTSQRSGTEVRRSLKFSAKSPAGEATAATIAIRQAKMLVHTIWSRTGESAPKGSEELGFW